jgi:hypothetical protein
MDGPMNRETYRVTISREEPWWVAAVDGIGATEAKKIAEIESMVRDLITVMRDLDGPDFDLVWDYDLPAEAAQLMHLSHQRVQQLRTRAGIR